MDLMLDDFLPAVTRAQVDREADRRIEGGFWFEGGCFGVGVGYRFDSDKGKGLPRLTGAGSLAGFAMGAGAPAGYFLWHGGTEPFEWITQSNEIVQIDAPTMFAIAQAAATHQSRHVHAARALKDTAVIPLDYRNDRWWP